MNAPLTHVALAGLIPSPANPRKHFDEAKLAELAESIRVHGVLQPLVVRPKGDGYEIVAGERRFRAAKLAGLESVPVVVREIDDRAAAELAVLENVQRDDLTALEEADGFRFLVECHGFTSTAIAARVGKSAACVSNRLVIARATAAVREALFHGRINATIALILGRLPAAQQEEAVTRLSDYRAPSVRDAMQIAAVTERSLPDAPFDTEDATLTGDPRCSACPKRTLAEARLFADVSAEDHCLDGVCWRRKCDAAFAALAERHKGRILTAEEVSPLLDEFDREIAYDAAYRLRSEVLEDNTPAHDSEKERVELERLPIILAQHPDTGRPLELVEGAKVDAIHRKHAVRPAAASAKVSAADKAKEDAAAKEFERCQRATEQLIAAAINDRANAARRLICRGSPAYGGDWSQAALEVAGVKAQNRIGAWAWKASKEDFAAFLLAEALDNAYANTADQVRRLAEQLDLPIPDGFEDVKTTSGKGAKALKKAVAKKGKTS